MSLKKRMGVVTATQEGFTLAPTQGEAGFLSIWNFIVLNMFLISPCFFILMFFYLYLLIFIWRVLFYYSHAFLVIGVLQVLVIVRLYCST